MKFTSSLTQNTNLFGKILKLVACIKQAIYGPCLVRFIECLKTLLSPDFAFLLYIMNIESLNIGGLIRAHTVDYALHIRNMKLSAA